MNLLFITEKDAANASLGRIANAFLHRGHNIKIYAPFWDCNILTSFNELIERFPYEDMGEEVLSWCDAIFMSSVSANVINGIDFLKIHKPIFTHNYLINGQVSWGGDLCFVSSVGTSYTEFDKVIPTLRLGIGEPKYDSVLKKEDKKKFGQLLFIDSGHFPFGEEGKRELAKCLLSLCRNYPTYRLVIKPRFLPGDRTITHRNLQLLYDFVQIESNGHIPDNMIFLQEHRDLMTLIEESDTVICLYTTAFVGAGVARKGLVILDGLESEDVYDVRKKSFLRIRERMECTNALIPFTRADEILPNGVLIDEECQKKLFAERDDSAIKICEVVEYMCTEFFFINRFPRVVECSYCDYQKSIRENESENWNKWIAQRIRNFLMVRTLIHIDFNLSTPIDVSLVCDYINAVEVEKIDLDMELKKIKEIRSKCIVQNRDMLIGDEIDCGILLNAYYILHDYESIIGFERKDISSYYLFLGFSYYDLNNEELALKNIEKYLEMTKNRQYIKEISDMSDNRFKAYEIAILYHHGKANLKRENDLLKELKQFYCLNYLTANLEEIPKTSVQAKHLNFIKSISIQNGGTL